MVLQSNLKSALRCKGEPLGSKATSKRKIHHCPYKGCKYSSTHFSSLRQHLAYIHDEGVKWHYCNLCDYKAKKNGTVRRHKADVHNIGVVWYPCSYPGCTYKAKQKSHMKRHVQVLHAQKKVDNWEFCKMSATAEKHVKGTRRDDPLTNSISCRRSSGTDIDDEFGSEASLVFASTASSSRSARIEEVGTLPAIGDAPGVGVVDGKAAIGVVGGTSEQGRGRSCGTDDVPGHVTGSIHAIQGGQRGMGSTSSSHYVNQAAILSGEEVNGAGPSPSLSPPQFTSLVRHPAVFMSGRMVPSGMVPPMVHPKAGRPPPSQYMLSLSSLVQLPMRQQHLEQQIMDYRYLNRTQPKLQAHPQLEHRVHEAFDSL